MSRNHYFHKNLSHKQVPIEVYYFMDGAVIALKKLLHKQLILMFFEIHSFPQAFAAPVDAGIIFEAPPRPSRQLFFEDPSTY